MIHFLLLVEKSVSDGDYWIIVTERRWVHIDTQQVRDIDLLVVLDIKNKQLLDQAFLKQDSLDVENINKLSDSNQELDLVEFVFESHFVPLVLQKYSIRALLIHIYQSVFVFLDQCSKKDV